MSDAPPLYELATSYWKSASLQAALELGLFEALDEGPQSVDSLAASLSCDRGALQALLDALTGLELLEKTGGDYQISPRQAPFLTPSSKDSLLAAFAFNRDLQSLWDHLADSVRNGAPVMPSSPHLGQDPDKTRRFVQGMHSRASLMARGLLEVVRPETGAQLLDLAGGPGTFSLRLLERDPTLSITVFDLPPVVQAAEEIHRDHPFGGALTFTGGDYHRDDPPGGMDTVLYCGALHQELPEQVPDLLQRIKTVLKPGGTLLVVDLLLDDDRTTPVYAALFDLNMRLMRPTSHVHSVSEVKEALTSAGYHLLRSGEVPQTPYRFVEASLES
jgi:acetylserotonin N-methyltransferase